MMLPYKQEGAAVSRWDVMRYWLYGKSAHCFHSISYWLYRIGNRLLTKGLKSIGMFDWDS